MSDDNSKKMKRSDQKNLCENSPAKKRSELTRNDDDDEVKEESDNSDDQGSSMDASKRDKETRHQKNRSMSGPILNAKGSDSRQKPGSAATHPLTKGSRRRAMMPFMRKKCATKSTSSSDEEVMLKRMARCLNLTQIDRPKRKSSESIESTDRVKRSRANRNNKRSSKRRNTE